MGKDKKSPIFMEAFQTVDKLSERRYFAIGATCYKAARQSSKKVYKTKIEKNKHAYLSAGKLSKTEGGGKAEAMDGGGGH